ncbi:MAG: hypothetical protein M1818_002195 [Claussenomyces sp. TS43310]|nr:MAG: hypothetical protein M1818_002195 [Claussenomyces sp. TS43310]
MASLSAEDRARIVANNKSLRLIKNELEGLAERGVVTDEQYDTIMAALPVESPLRNAASTSTGLPAPTTTSPAPPASNQLSDTFAAMNASDPARNPTPSSQGRAPPPPPPARKSELSHAVALYAYPQSDPNDLSLERGDHISVTEYMNADWWSGTNVRTGLEGIFPRNYVRTENFPSALAPQQQQQQRPGSAFGEEKSGYGAPPQYSSGGGYPGQPVYGGYPPSPYSNPVPPMAIAGGPQPQAQPQPVENQPAQPGRGSAMAKKFGSKLGNAAIFGAGATMGADVVNSIF